jgi:hypothetical protein
MSGLRVKSGTRSLQNLVLEGHVLNHFAGGIGGDEHLDVLNVTGLLACVDLGKNGHRFSSSLCLSGEMSVNSFLNVRLR